MSALIAVIDDDETIVALIREVLTDEGYRTLCVQDARQAATTLAATPPDVIVMDWHMRGLSGWDLLNGVRQQPATAAVPVLICSGDALFLRDHRDALRAMGCETLHKPFDLTDLLDRVATLLPAPTPEGNI